MVTFETKIVFPYSYQYICNIYSNMYTHQCLWIHMSEAREVVTYEIKRGFTSYRYIYNIYSNTYTCRLTIFKHTHIANPSNLCVVI
jgi:hypothetical protein